MNGPATLQLFDTNVGPRDAASSPIVEIIRTSISNSENVDASLKTWEKLSGHLARKDGYQASVAYGKSLNLENDVVAGIIGWQGSKVGPISCCVWKAMLTLARSILKVPKERISWKR
jgi:hypothetical protein